MNVDRSKSLEDLEDGYWGDHPDQIGELDKIVVKVSVLANDQDSSWRENCWPDIEEAIVAFRTTSRPN